VCVGGGGGGEGEGGEDKDKVPAAIEGGCDVVTVEARI
jgi:hypothetical protein